MLTDGPNSAGEHNALAVPEVKDSGSAGTQQMPSGQADAPIEKPLGGLSIAQTVQGLAATRSRSLGGATAATLLASSVSQIFYDLQTTKQELHQARDELKDIRNELSNVKIEKAVLRERLDAISRERTLKNLCITIGVALFGIALEVYRNNLEKLSYTLIVLSLVLLLIGWLSPRKETDQ
jgi:hypothetical protein